MRKGFTGRRRELDLLARQLDQVGSGDTPGRALLLRGRRRVGKSRLVEVFCEGAGVPWVFFTATAAEHPMTQRRELFRAIAEESTLPERELAVGAEPPSWDAAFRQLATLLPAGTRSIVVVDELPYLSQADPAFEGALQTCWDRYLSRKPVLLIGVGSDLSMMELLASYGRPFHQRAAEMVLDALSPAEVGSLLGLAPAEAIDAYLITGGLPLVCRDWPHAASATDFLKRAFADPTSALLVSGERTLAAEFPGHTHARTTLMAIGRSGERTFGGIANRAADAAEPANPTTLTRSLAVLTDKRIIAADLPLSTVASKEKRYRVADPYLRFWLAFVAPAIAAVERGRGDLALRAFRAGWPAWRGRAVEPVVRQALARLISPTDWPAVTEVGGWWPRSGRPELDLVGADKAPVAGRIGFVGSIKWRDRAPFDRHDFAALARDAVAVPGVDAATPLVAVCRGTHQRAIDRLAALWTAADLVTP